MHVRRRQGKGEKARREVLRQTVRNRALCADRISTVTPSLFSVTPSVHLSFARRASFIKQTQGFLRSLIGTFDPADLLGNFGNGGTTAWTNFALCIPPLTSFSLSVHMSKRHVYIPLFLDESPLDRWWRLRLGCHSSTLTLPHHLVLLSNCKCKRTQANLPVFRLGKRLTTSLLVRL